ncbi:MAG: restriction endonuclease subunit S [Pseudanabaenales cyanobacterium]|nr:restriction endonuclease subunit S [Pseudanabaenales cyanobacterium]
MNWEKVHLSVAAEINPRSREWSNLSDEDLVSFIPMPAISEFSASIIETKNRALGEVKRGYTPFQNGDVLFAKITPCMENGKAALAKDLANGFGFGSTEFHVLRPRESVLSHYLYYFIRQPSFRTHAKQRMSGAVGQQRVPVDFMKNYTIPLPPISEQRRIVEILDQADALRKKRAEADKIAERILPALFIKMFGDSATNRLLQNLESLS